jgi:hypothetical protein
MPVILVGVDATIAPPVVQARPTTSTPCAKHHAPRRDEGRQIKAGQPRLSPGGAPDAARCSAALD